MDRSNINELEQVLNQWGNRLLRPCLVTDGEIKSVDKTKFTCEIIVGEAVYSNVSLKTITGSQASFVEIPKIGTDCLISFKHNNIQCPQLFSVHECDEILIKVGDSVLNITDGLFEFNGGALKGMIKAVELKTQLDKNTARIDGILNILTTAITGVSLQPNPGWSAIINPLIASINANKETYTNIEDLTITH